MANPDIVMMDFDMPGISSIEAVHTIKQKYTQVQILMQTVFYENDKIFAAICAGASGYMLKKTSPQKMIEAIYETYNGGVPMTASVAIKVLQMFRLQIPADTKKEFIDLSKREKEILSLLVKGRSYKTISTECFISKDTVSMHVRYIYEKLHLQPKS